MTYERPQHSNEPTGTDNATGGRESDVRTGGAEGQSHGGPRGPVYDPTSQPPQYGVRVPESQQAPGGWAGQPQPAQQNRFGQQNQYGQQPWGQGQQAQNYYAAGTDHPNANPYDQPYVAPPVTPGRGWAIAAVVLGSVSIVLFFLGITVLLALLGLIFGIVALVKAGKVTGTKKGMGITGLVLSGIGLILSGIALAFWVVVGGMTWQILQDPAAQECISQYMADQDQAAYEQCLNDVVNGQ